MIYRYFGNLIYKSTKKFRNNKVCARLSQRIPEQFFPKRTVAGAHLFQQGVETGTVVGMAQVAEFV